MDSFSCILLIRRLYLSKKMRFFFFFFFINFTLKYVYFRSRNVRFGSSLRHPNIILALNRNYSFLFLFYLDSEIPNCRKGSCCKEQKITPVEDKVLTFWYQLYESNLKSTYAKVHDPHTICLKCFPWCYYTITWQAIPMARSYQYQWLCKTSSKYSLEFTLPIMLFRPWDVSA